MWKEMINTRHQAQDAVRISKKSADEAMAQVQRNFVTDQRPYVWLTDDLGPFSLQPHNAGNTSDKLGFNFHYKNFGKSPAINTRTNGRILFGKSAEKRITLTPLDPSLGSIIPPTKEGWNTAWSDYPISDPQLFNRINTRGLIEYVIISGHIQYSDSFGNVYDSEFCLERTPNVIVYAFCDTHNQIR